MDAEKKQFLRKPRMNNLQLGYQRNDLTYEAIMTDLVLMGIVDQDMAEAFMGRKISDGIKVPPGAEAMLNGEI